MKKYLLVLAAAIAVKQPRALARCHQRDDGTRALGVRGGVVGGRHVRSPCEGWRLATGWRTAAAALPGNPVAAFAVL